MKRPGVFLRESTGLVKNVTLVDAISLNLSSMSVGTTLAILGFTTILLPSVSGLNLVYASIIGFALSIPQIVVYTMMSSRISRTGGDYVWVSRTFGGLFGGPISFMGFALRGHRLHSARDALHRLGPWLRGADNGLLQPAQPGHPRGEPDAQFVIGAAILTAIILLNILRPKAGFKFLTVLMVVGIFTILLAFAELLHRGAHGGGELRQLPGGRDLLRHDRELVHRRHVRPGQHDADQSRSSRSSSTPGSSPLRRSARRSSRSVRRSGTSPSRR